MYLEGTEDMNRSANNIQTKTEKQIRQNHVVPQKLKYRAQECSFSLNRNSRKEVQRAKGVTEELFNMFPFHLELRYKIKEECSSV